MKKAIQLVRAGAIGMLRIPIYLVAELAEAKKDAAAWKRVALHLMDK